MRCPTIILQIATALSDGCIVTSFAER